MTINSELQVVSKEDVYNVTKDLLAQIGINDLEHFAEEMESFAFIDFVIGLEDVFGIVIETSELIMETFCNINYIVDYVYRQIFYPDIIDVTEDVVEVV